MDVLYLEDEPNDATLVIRCLNALKHNPVIATTLDEARSAVMQQPDLIMIDIVLGHSRAGFQFARELRAQGYQQPMIAVTGLVTTQDLEECQEAGFNHILSKPFTIPQLVDVIHMYTQT